VSDLADHINELKVEMAGLREQKNSAAKEVENGERCILSQR
jgi:ribosomal protein L29